MPSLSNFDPPGRDGRKEPSLGANLCKRLVANTGGVNMRNFDGFLSVLLPAPSPALPEAMAGATSMEGYSGLRALRKRTIKKPYQAISAKI